MIKKIFALSLGLMGCYGGTAEAMESFSPSQETKMPLQSEESEAFKERKMNWEKTMRELNEISKEINRCSEILHKISIKLNITYDQPLEEGQESAEVVKHNPTSFKD